MSTRNDIINLIGDEDANAMFVFFGGRAKAFSMRMAKPEGLAINHDSWLKLINMYHNCFIYIPKPDRRKRNEAIIHERRKGATCTHLSIAFGLTAKQINRICAI